MGLRKGQTNNPNGRPKKPEIEALRKAVKAVEKERGISLLKHFVEQAIDDKTVLVALMKKFLPDMKSQDINITSKTFADIVRDIANARNARKSHKTS